MKKIWETIKLLVVISFCVYAFMLVGGCANPTKDMTPEQKTKYIEQRNYERQAKRDEEHDKIRLFVRGCKQAGGTIWYTGPTRIGRRCPRNQVCIHRHASMFDYQCLSDAALRDIMRQLNGGGRF